MAKNINTGGQLLLRLGTVWLAIMAVGCAVTPHQKGLNLLNNSQYKAAIELLEQAEADEPNNALIKRDLGVSYYKTRRVDDASKKLLEAKAIEPKDGKTIFYLGLCYEQKKDIESAIAEYKQYIDLSRSKQFKLNISVRIRQLTNEQITRAVARSVAQEQAIDVNSIPPKSVAVLYFKNLSTARELDPLQKGLTQMLITDLAKAKQLKVVERVRLQKLLEELKLGTGEFVERSSAPRVGKLIGASKLVQGGFTDLSDENLRIDAALAQTGSGEINNIDEITGKLNTIFQLEKNLTFQVIDELGIKLTREERLAIQESQTESLLAFIAYSRGLDFEDRSMYPEAKTEYQKAARIDPGFALAKQSLQELDIAQKAAQSAKTDIGALESEYEEEFSETTETSKNSRLVSSSFAAQTGQVPQGDNDTREPVQEANGTDNATLTRAIVPILVPLPADGQQ